MSYTNEQLEAIADALRSAGFVFDDSFDNDKFAIVADCVLEAFGLEVPEINKALQ